MPESDKEIKDHQAVVEKYEKRIERLKTEVIRRGWSEKMVNDAHRAFNQEGVDRKDRVKEVLWILGLTKPNGYLDEKTGRIKYGKAKRPKVYSDEDTEFIFDRYLSFTYGVSLWKNLKSDHRMEPWDAIAILKYQWGFHSENACLQHLRRELNRRKEKGEVYPRGFLPGIPVP